ncbi:hypothetical protein K5D68_00295 [Pseudomonas cichorii]|nr:hypothetical protein [Pseudomonas cichorii]MBX8583235.1 hypothetical protein [Pseudomonas cichorii]MBX8596596.1 hypothetical protein [Pseudomonas cichorii]MBX8615796.1 hypothetical protein [Pseudomonas cichorii]
MTLQGYFASVADSDLFGLLAIICLLVAALGISRRVREKRAHKIMMYVCVLIVPVIHIIGTYYLNQAIA